MADADLFGCALIRTPEQIRWSEGLSGLQACGSSPPRLSLSSALALEKITP